MLIEIMHTKVRHSELFHLGKILDYANQSDRKAGQRFPEAAVDEDGKGAWEGLS